VSDKSDQSDRSDPTDTLERSNPLRPVTPPSPPTLSRPRLLALQIYLAFVLTTGLAMLTSLMESADRLNSHDLAFRRQTEALLDGRFGLAEDAGGMAWDLAFGAHGTVQQVWGLGVPLLRLPFEALARVFGKPAFPETASACSCCWASWRTRCWARYI
jgi:hypothetical protein